MKSLRTRPVARVLLAGVALAALLGACDAPSFTQLAQKTEQPRRDVTAAVVESATATADASTAQVPTPVQTYPPIVNPTWVPFPSPTPAPYTPPPYPTLPPPPAGTAMPTVTALAEAAPGDTTQSRSAIAWGVERDDNLTIWLGDYSDAPTPAISDARPLAHWDKAQVLLDMAASPDGRFLALLTTTVYPAGAQGTLPHWLYLVDVNTNQVRSIPDFRHTDLYTEFYFSSPSRILGWLDDNRLAIGERPVVATTDGASYSLVTFDRGGSNMTALSPDGTTFFSTRLNAYGYGLWLCDTDGGNARRIFDEHNAKEVAEPVWSPDGKHIAFMAPKSELRSEPADTVVSTVHLWLLDPVALTYQAISPENSDAWDAEPAWSPDGRQIAYLRANAPMTGEAIPYNMPERVDTNIFVTEIGNQATRQLTTFEGVRNSGVRWTNGGHIVLSSTLNIRRGEERSLIAVSASDGNITQLLSGSAGDTLVHPVVFSR